MTTTNRIYPVYLCRSRVEKRLDETTYWDVYQQDVVAFAPTRSQGEAYAHELNQRFGYTDDEERKQRVYFTVGHGREGIVALPKAITLVGTSDRSDDGRCGRTIGHDGSCHRPAGHDGDCDI